MNELQAFKNQLANNQLSTYYTEQLFSAMPKEVEKELSDILQLKLKRYARIPEVQPYIDSSDNAASLLKVVFDIFPSFFFLIGNELNREPALYKYAILIQIAGIASALTRRPERNGHVRLLLEHIDPEDDLEVLNEKASIRNTDQSYIPKIVNMDFILIRKKYKNLVVTKDIHELIGILFCFQGLMQVFLKYYFELICEAPNDNIGQHIDTIFSGMFAALKYQEIKYWNSFTDSRKLQGELYHVIRMDSPNNRHPVLRKHIFDNLKHYHPIIKDARSRYALPEVRQAHMKQLESFHALSTPRLATLLGIVQLCKGRSHLVYLLSQILKTDNQKLYRLSNHLKTKEDGSKSNKDLQEIVGYFVDKLTATQKRSNLHSAKKADVGTVIHSAESLRKLEAKKKRKAMEAKGALTADQVSGFMKERLNKLYQRIKVEGALSQDKVTQHLTQFTDKAQQVLSQAPTIPTQQAVEDLKTSTNNMLQDISDDGHLTSKEVATFKLNVQAKANELANSTDSEKRTKIVEEIGLTLSNASIESEKRGKEIRWERVHDGTAETSGEAGKKPGEAQWERAQNDDYTVVSDKSNQAATTSPREINRKVEIGEKGLNYDQVSRFLDDKLHELYTKVKKAGALTEDNITQYLGAFAESVQPLVVKIPSGQRDQIVEEFRVSTDEILQNISDNGQLSPEKVKSYKNEIHLKIQGLDTPSVAKRTNIIQTIGLTLARASKESDEKRKDGADSTRPGKKRKFKATGKALTQDQVPAFLDEYMKKMYARVKKEGALTQDKISEYLAQFANASQRVVISMPAAKQKEVIEEFKVSTDSILQNIADKGHLKNDKVEEIRLEIYEQSEELDTPDVEERIDVVDKIGLILTEVAIESEKKDEPKIDEKFLKQSLIPYGFEETAKRLSVYDFFSFPFGDRKGPQEDDWFSFHFRYLEIIVERKKLQESVFKKIFDTAPHLPKIKYKKYFNIFPSDEFEETTFMAVFDLWQNKAIEKLRIES